MNRSVIDEVRRDVRALLVDRDVDARAGEPGGVGVVGVGDRDRVVEVNEALGLVEEHRRDIGAVRHLGDLSSCDPAKQDGGGLVAPFQFETLPACFIDEPGGDSPPLLTSLHLFGGTTP